MTILDATGSPYPATPRRPLDVPSVTRTRDPAQRWSNSIGRLTPERVANLLTAANQGDAESYLTLASDAEERYGHYAAVLQTRKLAITGEETQVSPADDSSQATEIADAFRELVVESPAWADLELDLLDGIAKGYSVVQPIWDTTTRPWTFAGFEWQDPRLFQYDKPTLRTLRMRHDQHAEGIEIPPGQFVVHAPRTRSGVPLRAGIIRPIVVAWMMQSNDVAWWATFAEVFGMPTRVGKFDPATAGEYEISQLRTALYNIGHDAAAIIPEGMNIEMLDARRPTSGDNVYKEIADYWDGVTSKVVLGQTMTTDNGSSLGQAKIHNEVRLDLRRADARALCATLRMQVAAPWVLYNYGEGAPVPKLAKDVDPDEDLAAYAAAVTPFIKAGLRVPAKPIREKLGIPDPAEGEELIELPEPPTPAPGTPRVPA